MLPNELMYEIFKDQLVHLTLLNKTFYKTFSHLLKPLYNLKECKCHSIFGLYEISYQPEDDSYMLEDLKGDQFYVNTEADISKFAEVFGKQGFNTIFCCPRYRGTFKPMVLLKTPLMTHKDIELSYVSKKKCLHKDDDIDIRGDHIIVCLKGEDYIYEAKTRLTTHQIKLIKGY